MKTKVCSRCRLEKPITEYYNHSSAKDGLDWNCIPCKRATTTEWRHKNRAKLIEYNREYRRQNKNHYKNAAEQWRQQNAEKLKAHNKVQTALRNGTLKEQPCVKCGDSYKVYAHHENYSKPLDVIWLCASHHREIHNQQKDKKLRACPTCGRV